MPNLVEVHKRIQEKRKERKEINKMFQDELRNNQRYQEIAEELKKLREEKHSIEDSVRMGGEAEKLDLLKLDIKSDTELLSDLALNKFLAQEPLEIVDENNAKWLPSFSVAYKKEEDAGEEKK